MTLQVGIIGYPLGHSISPAFHQAAFDHLGLDVRYEAWETPPEQLAQRLQELRDEGVLGFNVTVPHKEPVLSLMDEVTEDARNIGAVNTAVHRDGRLIGHNTDASGFLRALKEDGSLDPQGKRALVLGAGGAARAVCFALRGAGATAITIANRTVERAVRLVGPLLGSGQSDIQAVSLTRYTLMPLLLSPGPPDLIVNCTSLGMLHGPDPGASPLDADLIPASALVCDLVYNPPETPLLAAAHQAGARTLGGLPMLVYQGAAAFQLWTGREAPLGVMFEAAREDLAQSP